MTRPRFRSGRAGREAVERSLVWMLGSPRTGSTWLLNLLAVSDRVVRSDEPGIGYHLSLFSADVMGPHPASFDEAGLLLPAARAEDPNYFFAHRFEAAWREPLRRLVLDRFGAQLGEAIAGGARDPLLVVKEPAGSQAAGFLVSLFPASRLLFLVRDGRDVLDSILDAVSRGSWLGEEFRTAEGFSESERIGIVRAQAHRWVHRMAIVQAAFDRLPQRQRMLVRYEDLRAGASAQMREILDWLGLAVDEARLAEHIEATSFEALPPERRGPGQFARHGAAGAWRQSLAEAEQRLVQEIMGPTLRQYGYID